MQENIDKKAQEAMQKALQEYKEGKYEPKEFYASAQEISAWITKQEKR
jgi:hypothetical protein